MGLLDIGIKIALGKVRDNVINPKLEGIGKVEEISYRERELFVRLRLEELEDHPLEVVCSDITLADDGSSVRIGKFRANKKFMQTALDRYLAGKAIPVPEGARLTLAGAKKMFGL